MEGTKNAAADQAGGDAKRRKEENGASNGDASKAPEKADSDSASDDEQVDRDIEKIIARAQGKGGDSDSDDNKPMKGEKKGDDSDSDSDSSSSSSTTSSSSSSSSSDQDQAMEAYTSRFADDEDEVAEEELSPEDQLKRDFEAVRAATLKRKDLLTMLDQLPPEEAFRAIKRAWVRITIKVGVCVLAQVTDLVDEEPYQVDVHHKGKAIKVALRCRRCMPPERNYKLIYVSNQDVTMAEFEQWVKLVNHHDMELKSYRPVWSAKASDIQAAKTFKFSEDVVNKMLRRKTDLGINFEFNAQKESRLRSEVQAAVSQMEICGLRETRATELEQRDRQARSTMALLHQKAAKHQEEWFENRPNLYSITEVNKKNKERQVARDKHALMHTYEMDAEDEELIRQGKVPSSNPYERRACRPVSAWDTRLSFTAELDPASHSEEAKAAAAKARELLATTADVVGASTTVTQVKKVRDMKTHRHLWSMIASDRAAGDKKAPSSKGNNGMHS